MQTQCIATLALCLIHENTSVFCLNKIRYLDIIVELDSFVLNTVRSTYLKHKNLHKLWVNILLSSLFICKRSRSLLLSYIFGCVIAQVLVAGYHHPGLIQRQSVWDLRWTKWQRDMSFGLRLKLSDVSEAFTASIIRALSVLVTELGSTSEM